MVVQAVCLLPSRHACRTSDALASDSTANASVRELVSTFVQLTESLAFNDNERRLLLDMDRRDMLLLTLRPEAVDTPRLRQKMLRSIGVLQRIIAAS